MSAQNQRPRSPRRAQAEAKAVAPPPAHELLNAPPLPAAFFARDAAEVAPALLGNYLVVATDDRPKVGRVVETEAYVGAHDLACHAAKGRTARTDVMYGPPGSLYIYLIYGIHEMLNVVTGADGEPQAVLIRALEPLQHPGGPKRRNRVRTDGPGRLTRAFGIDRRLNGASATGPELWFVAGPPPRDVRIGPRIGIDYAGAWRDAPLRFCDADSAWLSRPLPRQG